MKIAMKMRPNRIQMIEKIRATIDFGALSPYLMEKETTINSVLQFYLNRPVKEALLEKYQMKNFIDLQKTTS